MVDVLPRSAAGDVIGRQLLRCATSVGANYRSACRGRSSKDFIAKMGIVEEECDESLYWMELLVESGRVEAARMEAVMREASAILAMTVASIKTSRSHCGPAIPNRQSQIRNRQCRIVKG